MREFLPHMWEFLPLRMRGRHLGSRDPLSTNQSPVRKGRKLCKSPSLSDRLQAAGTETVPPHRGPTGARSYDTAAVSGVCRLKLLYHCRRQAPKQYRRTEGQLGHGVTTLPLSLVSVD
ncbi:hypothetical protein J6590_045983 [Homalodisca vitripennis]|nr:hypothetical protein J6590_045983 [Homalodisca vitripennis]